MSYIYPNNFELQRIAPALIARMSQERLGFQIMPMRDVMAATVEWEQKDNYKGLQQLRGLDGSPTHVKPIGLNRYSYKPGVYGEFSVIGETELTERAGMAPSNVPIPVGDLVLDRQEQLIQRELDRCEQIIWTLLSTGTFSIALPGGAIGFTDTFSIQTYSRIVAWGTFATAVPSKDFRAVALLGRGKGASFGAGAMAVMNRSTANDLMNNANSADMFGRRTGGGNTFNTIADLNRYQTENDLPQVVVYDEGYYDDSNTFQLYVPNNVVIVVGKRAAGQRIGEYVKTLNANNPNRQPGSYTFTIDRANAINGEKRVPPNMEVHQGHNGGPVIYYPGSIVVMTV